MCPYAVRIARNREGGSENRERRYGGKVELTLAFEVGDDAQPHYDANNELTHPRGYGDSKNSNHTEGDV